MVIPEGFGQVNFILAGGSLTTGAEWTCGFEDSTEGDTALQIAERWGDFYADSVAPSIVDSYQLQEVHVKLGPEDTGPSASLGAIINGEAEGLPAPANVSYLMSKNTAVGGRAGRGRAYIPGVPEEQVDGAGFLEGGWRAAFTTSLEEGRLTLIANGIIPVVLHSLGSPIATPTPITGFQIQGKVATQRQRLRR